MMLTTQYADMDKEAGAGLLQKTCPSNEIKCEWNRRSSSDGTHFNVWLLGLPRGTTSKALGELTEFDCVEDSEQGQK